MSRKKKTIAFALMAVLGVARPFDVVEGFFLWPGYITIRILLPLAIICLLYLAWRDVYVFALRAKHWSVYSAVAVLVLLWALPLVPGYHPRLAGYYLRVKALADIPAILDWADGYASDSNATSQPGSLWERIPPSELSKAMLTLGSSAGFRRRDHALRIFNGGLMERHWGVTVGRNIAANETGWTANKDWFVWDCAD